MTRHPYLLVRTLALKVALLPLALVAAEPANPNAANDPSASSTHARAHKVAHKPVTKTKHTAKAAAVAEPTAAAAPATEPAASDEHKLAVAQQVHTGRIACELGAHVTVTPDASRAGGFVVELGSNVFHMSPVVSSTGAVRLEDAKSGAMWLQLGNKSMLMNTKLGQRMADECQSPAQLAVAESLKNNPPPSLLDEPGVARK
jgi:hypothetical protein